jgi:hypothetical protein
MMGALMDKLVVHSVCSPDFAPLDKVKTSTALFNYHGYDYRLHVDPLWIGWPSKIWHYLDLVLNAPTEGATHYMFVDAADVVPLVGPDELLTLWKQEFNHPWVYCGEVNIWSPNLFQPEEYPTPPGMFRYLNAGICIGEVEHMKKWWSEWMRPPASMPESDQDWLHGKLMAHWPDAFILDQGCQLFQCMCAADPIMEIEPGYAYNTVTWTEPKVLHFNGGTDITWAKDPKSNPPDINRRLVWEHWLR